MRATSSGPKVKKLNLQTYKFHALGDYPDMIRLYRTTDSYSTQLVSSRLDPFSFLMSDWFSG